MRLLLLEEDYYVASDFIHMYKLIQRQLPHECPKCNIIALGTYLTRLDESTYNKVDISPWITNKHNMAMSFNRTTWANVRNCAEHFCQYDEYNYDFSLQNINRKCLKNKLFVGVLNGPRVFHVGECGIHHQQSNCDVDKIISEINSNLNLSTRQRLLYPEDLEIESVDLRNPISPLINNGGWMDIRDHCLCMQMTKNKQSIKCHKILTFSNDTNDL
jgi:hypothetical protein